jgi:hypothetical protein
VQLFCTQLIAKGFLCDCMVPVIFWLWAYDLQARAERVISSVVRLGGNYGGLTP